MRHDHAPIKRRCANAVKKLLGFAADFDFSNLSLKQFKATRIANGLQSLASKKRSRRAETIKLTRSKSRYGDTIPHIKAVKRLSILINRLSSQCFPSTKVHMNPLFQSRLNPQHRMGFRQTNEHIRQRIQTACHLPYSGTHG